MKYSFVIPVNNEEENLAQLLTEIDPVIGKLQTPSEVLFIDDGSTDNSLKCLQELRKPYPYIKIIVFDKNYGQSSGFDAGIQAAAGEVIITMDADLQNNPADVINLLKFYPEYEVVIGTRTRRNDSIVKLISSRIGNSVRNFITRDSIRDTGCSLKVFKSEIIKKVRLYHGMHRFMPTLCRMYGARVKEVPVSHRARSAGKSHYGIGNRALNGLMDTLAVRWILDRKLHYHIQRIEQ
ncbi:MAG: glycosyltransferase family 2 protein [Chitinispirillaceae bacterium]|nr:glycosyltransferase family 2 protein [Chitinispirillaceae bacterium]